MKRIFQLTLELNELNKKRDDVIHDINRKLKTKPSLVWPSTPAEYCYLKQALKGEPPFWLGYLLGVFTAAIMSVAIAWAVI